MIRGSAAVGHPPPLRIVVGLELPGLALGRHQQHLAAIEPPLVRREGRDRGIAFRLQEHLEIIAGRLRCWSASGRRSSGRCRAPSTSRRSSGPSTWRASGRRRGSAGCRRPRLVRRPSKMPLSTSVKSITGWPAASCSRTISSPLIFQAVMSLVNGSAAAQPGSSSSLSPCGVASPFIVTTQVLLRSVVASSHCPIMSFFRVEASCAAACGASASSAVSAATP